MKGNQGMRSRNVILMGKKGNQVMGKKGNENHSVLDSQFGRIHSPGNQKREFDTGKKRKKGKGNHQSLLKGNHVVLNMAKEGTKKGN